MKLLSLLISLVLGAAVLLVLIRPWGALESIVTEPPVSAVPAASPPETPPALPEAKPPRRFAGRVNAGGRRWPASEQPRPKPDPACARAGRGRSAARR